MNRRDFLARVGRTAAMTTIGSSILRDGRGETLLGAQAPAAPKNLRFGAGTKAVLQQSDFTYLGYYDIFENGLDTPFANGLTCRNVSGDLRMLWFSIDNSIHEVSLAGKNFGDQITNLTTEWVISDFLNYRSPDKHTSIWYETAKSRLWIATAVDYPDDNYCNNTTQAIYTLTLNSDGYSASHSNLRGPFGLQGIGARRIYGGAQAIPTWFQSLYGVGPYAVGWGGYASRMSTGLTVSLGPTAYAIPEPTTYSDNASIPTGSFKIMADFGGGLSSGDWYAAGHPTTFDRGRRITNPINYFDGGDNRQNPSTAPDFAPLPGAQWLSPAPDGYGRWAWGDTYEGGAVWIDGPTKSGFVVVGNFGGGKCYYAVSSLHSDYVIIERHIFDPYDFGLALQGSKPVFEVYPASMMQLNLSGMGAGQTVVGSTYDPVSKKYFILGRGINTYNLRLYVYSVNI